MAYILICEYAQKVMRINKLLLYLYAALFDILVCCRNESALKFGWFFLFYLVSFLYDFMNFLSPTECMTA